MTLEERAECIAMNAVEQDRSSEGLYFVDQKQFALRHLREAVAEALAEKACPTGFAGLSGEELVKRMGIVAGRLVFVPPVGEIFAVADEVQPTAVVDSDFDSHETIFGPR